MRERAGLTAASLLLLALLSGCPMTDDYFIQGASVVAGASATSGGESNGGVMSGQAGIPPSGGAGSGQGGAAGAGRAGSQTASGAVSGSAGTPGCDPTTERCNGHDDNCNDLVDEQACNSRGNGTTGCAGFVVGAPNHGYMLCTATAKDYADAQLACEQQSMRLAWLETEPENAAVSEKVAALTSDEVWIGASDEAVEGEWLWDGLKGGAHFWLGAADGTPVDGAFEAWVSGTPNDDNGGEDCAVLSPTIAEWGDRSCSTRYAYLCEEPD